MGKLEKKLEELNDTYLKEQADYVEKMQEKSDIATQYCYQFNSQVTIINVERHLMRQEINILYKFLKIFGNIGTKLTPFEFAAEDWLFVGSHSVKQADSIRTKNGNRTNPLEFSLSTLTEASTATADIGGQIVIAAVGSSILSSASIAAGTATLGMALSSSIPIALPVYFLASAWKNNSDTKKELEKKQKRYEENKICCKNNISKMDNEIAFLNTAVQIANMYRILIATIRDTITEKIIPELNGILAFLYADAIKNCIINEEDPDNAHIGNIAEYRGTPYESHYIFVKNVFDYYTLIAKFFTEPILSNIVQKRTVSKTEEEKFLNKLKEIGAQQMKLEEISSFGGEQE